MDNLVLANVAPDKKIVEDATVTPRRYVMTGVLQPV